MNKKSVALTEQEFKSIMSAIQNGFTYEENGKQRKFFPNPKMETVLRLEVTLGLRIGDILALRLCDIVKDGNRYRLDIKEQKTGKARTFTVPYDVYKLIKDYATQNERGKTDLLFIGNKGQPLSERGIQKNLSIVAKHLGLENVGTHSFRKTFATQCFTSSGYNVELVRELLQHSSVQITQRYIGIQQEQVENALSDVAFKFLD